MSWAGGELLVADNLLKSIDDEVLAGKRESVPAMRISRHMPGKEPNVNEMGK